ncbi:MAG: PKD domain-containing protein [Bacteroidota bacterium]
MFAARPSVHASNFTASNITCNSVLLNWVYGDGAARIIVAREGSAPSFIPSDMTAYSADNRFGKSTDMGSGNFIVYNAGGTNFIRIDSLKTGRTYYFTIYEHDNNAANTLYYTTSPPTVSVTTHSITLDFNIFYRDSCQIRNLYEFDNNSTSTIPGISYSYDYGDSYTGPAPTTGLVSHSYTISGNIQARLIATPSLGCVNTMAKPARVYRKKNAYIDFSKFKDSIQCIDGNYFVVGPTPYPSQLPVFYRYNWSHGDGTFSDFGVMKKTYNKSGRFTVQVEIKTFTLKGDTIGCDDTLRFDLVVLPNPTKGAIYDTVKCKKYNLFNFTNQDNNLTYFKWYFGDQDSSDLKTVTHKYADTGKYTVMHVAYASTGCKGRDTFDIRVLPDVNPNFNGLDPTYCTSKNIVTLLPDSVGGVFEGYQVDNPGYTFAPTTPGQYKLSYIYKTPFCSDTMTKDFEIFPTPVPSLGRDTAICSDVPFTLDAKIAGSYLWSDGSTNKDLTVTGTGNYWVKVSTPYCSAYDTASVVFSTEPIIDFGLDTSVCKGNALTLRATNPKSTYLWQDGSTDSLYFVYSPGKYWVQVTNPCGVTTDTILVYFQSDYCDLFMANAFSPDNDLLNNEFKPMGKNMTVKLFQIYNRWGQLIFETDKDNVGWNGQYNGKEAPQDLYLWKLFYTTPNGRYIKKSNAAGTVLLIR